MPGERVQKDSLGSVGVLGGVDEPKPECMSAGIGGHGALAGLGGGNDNVTRIVNKRFMRQTAGEEMVSIMGGGKDTMSNAGGAAGSGTEVWLLDMFSFPYNSQFTLTTCNNKIIIHSIFTTQILQTMNLSFKKSLL